jgi:aldehyde:ferredoxin oxidoreductase
VDLTHRKIEVEDKDDTFYRTYLGGRGIGYQYLLKEVPHALTLYLLENILVLARVMTGSPLPAACRFAAVGSHRYRNRQIEAAGFSA